MHVNTDRKMEGNALCNAKTIELEATDGCCGHEQGLDNVSGRFSCHAMDVELTLKYKSLSLAGLTRTLQGATVEQIQHDTVGHLFPIFIGETRRLEFRHVEPFDHVPLGRIRVRRCQNQITLVIDSDEAPFPQERVRELDINLADVDRLRSFRCLRLFAPRRRAFLLDNGAYSRNSALSGVRFDRRHAANQSRRPRFFLFLWG